MKKLLFFIPVLLIIVSCEKLLNVEPEKGEIRISTGSNYTLSDITIRRIDRVEDGKIYFDGDNYAGEDNIIVGFVSTSQTYEVDPGQYYVFLRYKNLNTNSSGWWKTTSKNFINVEKGDKWKIWYGYFGGEITKQ